MCGVSVEGGLYCWGDGALGQVGDGARVLRGNPTKIGEGFVDVLAGGAHACAVRGDGTAWCWGNGAFGQLGTGSYGSSPVPVRIAGEVSFAEMGR